jgi:hypothetical protein
METKETIVTTLSYLDDRLSVPVGTSMGENHNPRPNIVLNDYTRQDRKYHNTMFRGYTFDENGEIDERAYHKHYSLRLDFRIRARGEERGHEVTEALENTLLPLEEDANLLDEDINSLTVRSVSGVNPHHDLDSSEGTFSVTVTIETFKRFYESVDVLEEVETTYHYDYDSNSN